MTRGAPRFRCYCAGWAVLAWCSAGSSGATAAPQNLGFEIIDPVSGLPADWVSAGRDDVAGSRITIDGDVAAQGQRSLRIERSAETGATRLAQRLPAAALGAASAARRLRLAGVIHAATGVGASLWLRVSGASGVLYVDSRADALEPITSSSRDGSSGWQRYVLELPLPADADEIVYGVSVRGVGAAWFDALELTSVDPATLPPPTAAARRYVEAALAIIHEHALNAVGVDWPSLVAATLIQARGAIGPSDAHVAVRYAVWALADRHSYLQSPAAMQALSAAPVSNARTRQATVMPLGARLGGRVAYLSVPGFAGGSHQQQVDFAENLKTVLQANDLNNNCGWIVDLRRNSGGNLWPMLVGIGPLLGEGSVAASVYPDGRRIPVWYRDGQAGFGDYVQLRVPRSYRLRGEGLPPVAVLLGPGTASSAEVLGAAFRGRPRSRAFGAPTQGLAAGNRIFPLADGAALVLTVAATSDRLGQVYSGPLQPDELVAPSPSMAVATGLSDDPVVVAAIRWLERPDLCGPLNDLER